MNSINNFFISLIQFILYLITCYLLLELLDLEPEERDGELLLDLGVEKLPELLFVLGLELTLGVVLGLELLVLGVTLGLELLVLGVTLGLELLVLGVTLGLDVVVVLRGLVLVRGLEFTELLLLLDEQFLELIAFPLLLDVIALLLTVPLLPAL